MSQGQRRSRSERRRVLVAWATVLVLVVGLGGAAVVVATTGDDKESAPTVDTSPVLSLSRTSTTGVLADSAASAGGAAGYQLAGTLDQTAGQGVVIDPSGSTVDEKKVRTLLGALGMTSPTITEVDSGWTATGTAAGEQARFALDEKAGNLWQYGRGDLAGCLSVSPGADPNASVSCAAARSDVRKPGPGRAALVKEAAAVYELVGVTPGTGVTANDDGYGATYLDVPLTVEDLPVVDVSLSVGVDDDGIVSALGLLDPSYSTVGSYPLVSARTGFDQLGSQPVPAIGRDCTGQGPECSDPKPAKVTAARLAWLTSQNNGSTVLVPAWQFEVDGFYGPAVVAVEPRYLAPATAGTPEPDPASGSGQASSVPGSTGSGSSGSGGTDGREPMTDPGTPEPALPAPDAPSTR